MKDVIRKSAVKIYIGDFLYTLLGGGVFAVGLCVFAVPNNILIGGASGIATLLNHFFSFPIGLGVWLVNLPLIILTLIMAGKAFAIRTIACTTLFSAIIDIVDRLVPTTYTDDPLLAAIFGGIFMGIGLYLIMTRNLLTGGSELLAYLIQLKHPDKSISRLILAIDTIIIIAAAFFYRSIDSALYSVFMTIIYSLVLDNYLRGRTRGRIAFVFSNSYLNIKDAVINQLHRGVSIVDIKGGYTGESRNMLICALNLGQAERLKKLVYSIDSHAFIMLTEATSVVGEGFQSPEKGTIH